jgi:hypothetical protein
MITTGVPSPCHIIIATMMAQSDNPFLLEHSFSDSGFRPAPVETVPPSPPWLGLGIFLRFWVRVVRESAARLEIVLQMRLRVSVRSRKHFLFLGIFIITLTLPPICFPLLRACLLHAIGCLCLSVAAAHDVA